MYRLIERVHPFDLACDYLVDVSDGARHTLTAVALAVAVAKLDGLVLARGRARRDRGAAHFAAREINFGLKCRVAARVEYLARVDGINQAHTLLRSSIFMVWFR